MAFTHSNRSFFIIADDLGLNKAVNDGIFFPFLKSFHANHKIFFIKYILGLIRLGDIRKELEAQTNKLTRAGIKPAFINSHQHLHLLPGIMDIIIELARKFDIPCIRIVNEPIFLNEGRLFRQVQLLFLNFLSGLAKKKIKKFGLTCNDFFVGFINAGNLEIKDLKSAEKLGKRYPEKIVELGCHPGFESRDLIEKYSRWQYNWEKEIDVLKIRNDEDK